MVGSAARNIHTHTQTHIDTRTHTNIRCHMHNITWMRLYFYLCFLFATDDAKFRLYGSAEKILWGGSEILNRILMQMIRILNDKYPLYLIITDLLHGQGVWEKYF